MSDGYVAVLVIHLHLPEAHSLKAKRSELNAVKAHLRNRVGLSVAEVDHQDVWQRSTLSAALVARSITQLEETIDGVERYLDARFPDGARVDRTLASVEELRG